MSKLTTAVGAAALIPNKAMVAVSSSSGLCCLEALLKAIGERFDQTGGPTGLTMIYPIATGGDIAAWSGESPESFGRHWIRDGHAALDALARLSLPVIALLDGHALGGGLELAACADYRVAETHVKIGQPETGLGIIPGWSGTQRVVRRFGAQVVRRMAIFGEIFTAKEALKLGLVDSMVPSGDGMRAAETLAHAVLGRGPRATELAKMMINAAEGEERERVLESLAGALAAGSTDLAEGLAAFREKRPPNFKKD